jgi:phosphoribosylformimino-5-aminoimidazole carboxamide ribotide isomerase
MDLIPAVDIRGGRCVQLVQGDYARETVYGDDPVAMAQRWAEEGATRLHVVDLDGAREGRPVNEAAVAAIVRAVPGMRVQVAGGVRNIDAVGRWLEAGASRAVVGTMAVEEPDATEAVIARYGEQVAIAVDAREGKVASRGWLETSATAVEEFLRDMTRRGALHFIYTDISSDGMLQHIDFERLHAVLAALSETGVPATLIYSGGVTSIADVVALNEHRLEGAIIGTALYEGRLRLEDAKLALVTGDGTA